MKNINIENFVVQSMTPLDGDYYKHRLWKRRHDLGIPSASEAEAEFRLTKEVVIPASSLPEFDKPAKRRGKKK